MVFIREQGVIGLAIGFVMGSSISKVVTSLVNDIIQPLIGLIFGSANGLSHVHFKSVMYGNFIANIIDFVIIAFIVYFSFKLLNLEKLDIKVPGNQPTTQKK